jgi:hypothetical protein
MSECQCSIEKLSSVWLVAGIQARLPGTVTVAAAIGPSATSATPFSGITVSVAATSERTKQFLLRLAALKLPAVRRTTSPALTPSVMKLPAARAMV